MSEKEALSAGITTFEFVRSTERDLYVGDGNPLRGDCDT